jgi:radical SAM superfamily enzyme YgiQ (UPF0313 family)
MPRVDLTLVNAGPNVPRLADGRLLKPPPLAVLSLAAYLKQRGRTVQVLDYQLNSYPLEQQLLVEAFTEFLLAQVGAPVLGISTMTGMMPVVLLALDEYKRRRPQTTVILGGPGPSPAGAQILRHFRGVDIVAKGEGEETLAELLTSRGTLGRVRGICYRDQGEVRETAPRARMRSLDDLPLPAYEEIEMEPYAVANVYTARGCPFACAFCEVPSFWGQPVARRGLDHVIEEIKLLRLVYGKRRVNICDDTFIHHRGHVVEFCRRLQDERIDIEWECFARVDLMDEDLMRRMADSGCQSVFYGIESGSERVLKRLGKPLDLGKARETVSASREYFPRVFASFVWGFPFETMEEFFDTVLLMVDFESMGVQVQRPYLSLRPFSPLYHEYQQDMAFAESLPLYFLEVPRDYIPESVVSAIKQHPDIFPGFYYPRSRDFESKRRFMARLEGLGEDRWEILYDELTGALRQAVCMETSA